MCQQDLRDGVPNCHSAPAKAVGTLPPFRRPCLALFSYPLYKSSRAAKVWGDRNRLPRLYGPQGDEPHSTFNLGSNRMRISTMSATAVILVLAAMAHGQDLPAVPSRSAMDFTH